MSRLLTIGCGPDYELESYESRKAKGLCPILLQCQCPGASTSRRVNIPESGPLIRSVFRPGPLRARNVPRGARVTFNLPRGWPFRRLPALDLRRRSAPPEIAR